MKQTKRVPRRSKLNEVTVRQLRPPANGRLIVWDTEERGFGVRLSAALPGCEAHAAYVATYRVNGKRVMETIANVGDLAVAKARRHARRSRDMARDGQDPRSAQREPIPADERKKAAAERLKAAVDLYLEDYVEVENDPDTYRQKKRILYHYAIAKFGDNRPPRKITSGEVKILLREVGSRRERSYRDEQEGARQMANVLYRKLCHFFGWLKKEKIIQTNVMDEVDQPYDDVEGERIVSSDEIRWLWRACDEIGWPRGPLPQLMVLTDQRPTQVHRMSRLERPDGKSIWTIRNRNALKNKRGHIVHLSKLAFEIVESAPRIAGSDFLFSRSGKRPDWVALKKRLDRLMLTYKREELAAAGRDPDAAVIENWTFRDLRRTAATIMVCLGHSETVVHKIMNHAPPGGHGRGQNLTMLTRIYIKYQYLKQRKAALDDLGSYIEKVLAQNEPNIFEDFDDEESIPIRLAS